MNKQIEDKLEQGRTYRDMEIRALEDENESRFIVDGYASTFNEPYLLFEEPGYKVFEQVDSRAFDDTDMTDVIMQYDHEGRVFARMSNDTLVVIPDERGLRITADLGGTEIGRQLYEEIRGGYTNKMSFGFTVEADERKITEDKEAQTVTVMRTITKVGKLYDVSAVSLPANPATSISSRADGEGVIADAKEEILKAEEERKAIERQKQKIRILMEVNNGI